LFSYQIAKIIHDERQREIERRLRFASEAKRPKRRHGSPFASASDAG
jgi:hypothetical protein